MKRAALILVEYQNEWLSPQGKLNRLMQDRTQFERSIAASVDALDAARAAGMPVIHMGLRFATDHRELGGIGAATHGLRGAIPRAGTFRVDEPGYFFHPPFVPRETEFVGAGRVGASIFAGSNLDIYLRNQNIGKLYLMGYALHVCVLASLCHGHDLGYEVALLEECTAAFSPEQRALMLDHVVPHFGERLGNEAFLARLKGLDLRVD